MKPNEYQNRARTTAIYPGHLTYPALGLCGEAAELMEVWTEYGVGSGTDIVKEAGDVMWYVANLAMDASLSFQEILGEDKWPVTGAVWTVNETFMDLCIMAGKVAENVKKTMRDTDGVLSTQRRENIKHFLRKILHMLAEILAGEGVKMKKAAKINIKKLTDRAARNALKGDGDNR